MPDIKGVAHFSIPVSDVDRSTKFYTEIVGCKFLAQRPDKVITFLDAGGVCLLLIKRSAPIHEGPPDMSDGVQRASTFSSRRTGVAAQLTGRGFIFAIQTAPCSNTLIAPPMRFPARDINAP
jgi:catechol 2,3-dioxygenase-like lactoylglutathione lyase family enzyme